VIEFALGGLGAHSEEVRVRVRDLMGRSVRTLWSGTLCAGQRPTASWDGRDEDGRTARSGLYWIAVEGGGRRRAMKLVILD
jgi:flagellar hook assembly protein FlgD